MSSDSADAKNSLNIVIQKDLRGFFFEKLYDLNQRSLVPVPESTIYYSSEVLDRLSNPEIFFEMNEGKIKDKVLGLKLLKSTQLEKSQQKRELKDVGDTALLLCGKFSAALNRKIIDMDYYHKIGKMAYCRLNKLVPVLMDVPSFYEHMYKSFDTLTKLISHVTDEAGAKNKIIEHYDDWIENKSDDAKKELNILGITVSKSDPKKAS